MGVTGHRPERIIGYSEDRLLDLAFAVLEKYQPRKVITGMALGWDLAIAKTCVSLDIPFIAAVPFIGQESLWKSDDIKLYRYILSFADKVEIISDGGYSARKMQKRNEFIVNNSDIIISLWDGKKYGGTWNCINYARKSEKKITNFYKSWEINK